MTEQLVYVNKNKQETQIIETFCRPQTEVQIFWDESKLIPHDDKCNNKPLRLAGLGVHRDNCCRTMTKGIVFGYFQLKKRKKDLSQLMKDNLDRFHQKY